MLRPDTDRNTNRNTDQRRPNANGGDSSERSPYGEAQLSRVDIQRELSKLEELILDSPRIPLSKRTLVDEEQLLEQLDTIRLSLPVAFQEATEILLNKEEVLMEAEQYAQEIIATAEQRANQILDELSLVRQAEMEAQQIRRQVQQECEAMQQQTLAEIEQLRRRAQQELEDMQRMAIAECEEIQQGADNYADRVLRDMEQQLNDMMRIVRNGRSQLQPDAPSRPGESMGRSQPPRYPGQTRQ